MLNNTIFGGEGCREALQEASLKLEVDTDWCVEGCTSWKDSEEGVQRYETLKKRFHQAKGIE